MKLARIIGIQAARLAAPTAPAPQLKAHLESSKNNPCGYEHHGPGEGPAYLSREETAKYPMLASQRNDARRNGLLL